MPPYLRRRLFRGWDWFTPREVRHLPWRERERFTQEAWDTVRRHPRYWLMGRLLPLLAALTMFSAAVIQLLNLNKPRLIFLLVDLAFLVQMGTMIVWHNMLFRKVMRKNLLDAGIRPVFCFECGYELEGYEGKECPACDAPLLRQADSPPERS